MKTSNLFKKKSKASLSSFVRLARKYSEDPDRNRGGDLGTFYLGGNPKISHTFEKAAFAGKVDEVSQPILSPHGWHIIFVHDHQKRVEQALNEVHKGIREHMLNKVLLRTKFRLIKMLRSKAKIESYLYPNEKKEHNKN